MIYDPRWANAISGIESSGRYSLLGPVTKSGDRAYGKYQVMGNNVGPWTREALGREMTPQDFVNDPAAQDAVFKQQFSKNVEKYGSPQDAASVWFSGRPIAKAGNASDILGTTVPAYVAKFNRFMGEPGVNAINTAAHSGNSSGGASMPFETTPPPDDGFLGQLGVPAGFANRLGAAGAAMMALDNPRGAAAINEGAANRALIPLKQAAMMQKAQEPQFEYDPRSGTFFRTVNGQLQTQQNPSAPVQEAPKAKISETALKNVGKSMDDYDFINQTAGTAADILDDLKSGKLNLGALRNLENSGKNFAGFSDEQSRAYARYNRFVQDLVNSNLRLNNGVQTEGDAWRELKSIAANGTSYDNKTAEDALIRILEKSRTSLRRGASHLETRKATFGAEPFEAYEPLVENWKAREADIDGRLSRYKHPAASQQGSPSPKGARKTSTGVTWSIN